MPEGSMCTDVVTISQLEGMLGEDCRLVVGVAPPFCFALEEHFLGGEREMLRDVIIHACLYNGSEMHRVLVKIASLERSIHEDMGTVVRSGVIHDPGVLSGFLVREYQAGEKDRLILGRMPHEYTSKFEEWFAANGLVRDVGIRQLWHGIDGRILKRALLR